MFSKVGGHFNFLAHQYSFGCIFHAFCVAIYKREYIKVFHKGGTDFMKADLYKDWSWKQIVKVILTAGTHSVWVLAIKTKGLEYDGCFDGYFVKDAEGLHQIDRD